MLVVDDLRVRYGPDEVLHGIDLRVQTGQIVCVLGPSGGGKSTLLAAIAGLVDYSGSVAVDERVLDGLPPHRRGVGMMFQDDVLFPHLDVAHNIGYGLRNKDPRRVAQMLELVGMADYADRSVDSLSGGQAQRVALARALAPSPAVLLLDEPFGALDVVLKRQLVLQVQQVLREQAVTVLAVTHDRDEAFTLADRVAILREGRVVQCGSPDDLWHAPVDDYVAELVGLSVLGGKAYAAADLCLNPQGPWQVTVTGYTYRDGRYLILAGIDGRSVTFAAEEPLALGTTARIAVRDDR